MRLKRGKEGRKTLQFYRLNFGIAAPYSVLLDGNFIHAATSWYDRAVAAAAQRLRRSVVQNHPVLWRSLQAENEADIELWRLLRESSTRLGACP